MCALLLFGACGSHHADPTNPVTPKTVVAKFADGPPLVTPGEHMQYRLALQGVELAAYDLAIGETSQVAGKPAILVQSHAKTVGLGALVKVDDYFNSYLDVTT